MSQPGLNGTKGVVQVANTKEGRWLVTPQDAPGIGTGKAHTACMIELASTSQAARQQTAKQLHTQCGNASWQQRCCLTNGQFNEAEAMSRVALEAKERTHKKLIYLGMLTTRASFAALLNDNSKKYDEAEVT